MKRSRATFAGAPLAFFALAFGLLLPPAALAGRPAARIDPPLAAAIARVAPGTTVPVIVTMAGQVDLSLFNVQEDRRRRRARLIKALRDKAASDQAGVRRLLAASKVAEARGLWIINSLAAAVPAAMVDDLAQLPGVGAVRLDQSLPTPTPAPVPDTGGGAGWNLAAVGAPWLWQQGFFGQGVVVATLDSGVDRFHPDLAARWRGGTNSWLDPYGENPLPRDLIGHGTQVMGLIAGGDASGQAIGMAPGAQWMAAKIFNNAGLAFLSAIHAAFQWTLDPDGDAETDDAPDIVNNSWGLTAAFGPCSMEFEPDIRALRAADIAVVFAAGNDGPLAGSIRSPADNPGSTAVGAVDQDLVLDLASSRGPAACGSSIQPRLVAPGAGVLTTDLTFGGLIPDAYVEVHGTSFAAPHLAGGLALLRSALPSLAMATLEAILLKTAQDLGPPGPDQGYGYGLLDVAAAYDLLAGGAPRPADQDLDGHPASLDCDDRDAAVHPGAAEIRRDGIDQDCNGFDLTIEVLRADYEAASDRLAVLAESERADEAGLRLLVFLDNGRALERAMSWNAARGRWQRALTGLAGKLGARPVSVMVAGAEGWVESGVRLVGE
ncbi:MAG: S8 family serine peptidase [Thermodesulfobacteriota bacterium]